MGAHRDLAIKALKQVSKDIDFMHDANIPMPPVLVDGALPATCRELFPASTMHMLLDLVMIWSIGDYPGEADYSNYYNPESPWYNVFYGAYAMRSYKRDGTGWGYDAEGNADFDEFMKVPFVDYNFFTAGQFGCPPTKMCFEVTNLEKGQKQGWDWADIRAIIPSGLHKGEYTLGKPETYLYYGVPNDNLFRLSKGHESYEPVRMHGQMYMRPMEKTALPEPITLAWGGLCPETDEGDELLNRIMKALGEKYFPITGPAAR